MGHDHISHGIEGQRSRSMRLVGPHFSIKDSFLLYHLIWCISELL